MAKSMKQVPMMRSVRFSASSRPSSSASDLSRQSAARLLVTSMAESKPKPTRAILPARNPATGATRPSAEFQRMVRYWGSWPRRATAALLVVVTLPLSRGLRERERGKRRNGSNRPLEWRRSGSRVATARLWIATPRSQVTADDSARRTQWFCAVSSGVGRPLEGDESAADARSVEHGGEHGQAEEHRRERLHAVRGEAADHGGGE